MCFPGVFPGESAFSATATQEDRCSLFFAVTPAGAVECECVHVCVCGTEEKGHTHTHGQKQKLTLLPSHFPSAEAASAMSIFTGEQLREHGSNVNARISIWSEL